jgi:hypothetical protein
MMLEAFGEVLVVKRNHRVRWTERRDRVNTWRVIQLRPFSTVNDRDYTRRISESVFVYTITYRGTDIKECCFLWKILWKMKSQIWEVAGNNGYDDTFTLYFETEIDDVTPKRKRQLRKGDVHFRLALPGKLDELRRKLDELRRSSGVTFGEAHGRNAIFFIDNIRGRIRNVERIRSGRAVTDAEGRSGKIRWRA